MPTISKLTNNEKSPFTHIAKLDYLDEADVRRVREATATTCA